MTAQAQATAQLILERMGIPDLPGVYVLGSFASPVTFASQQERAFNLVWALLTSKRLSETNSVAVVGGGLAGLTVAAAAVLKQCKVTIIEKASQPLYLQRGNFTRYVHPNILNWPEPGAEIADTKFPIMNWHAAHVDDVVSQIEAQWDLISNRVSKRFGYEVDAISPVDKRTSVRANRIYGSGPTLVDEQFDCVIIAVGFGMEKSMSNVKFHSYWDNDGLHRELEPAPKVKRYLITGCGDGGLIDALRLRISNFKHEHLVSEFFSQVDMKEARETLLAIDGEFTLKTDDHITSQRLYKEYKERLAIPRALEERIKLRLRPDTHVTLNSPNPTPLSLRSSILNRFATFLLTEYGDLHYAQGMVQIKPENDEFAATFVRDKGLSHSKKFDEVIVRHGPDPSVNRLLPEETCELLRKMWSTNRDPTTERLWDESFFTTSTAEVVISSAKAIDLAAQQFPGAFSVLYDPKNVKSVAVASFGITGGYVVTFKKGSSIPESDRKGFLAGIPVTYVADSESLSAVSPIKIGGGIYNADSDQGYPQGLGSLGCFVRLNTGEAAILSTKTVLAGEPDDAIGDRIAHLSYVQAAEASIIAKLSAFTPISTSKINFADAAVAVLDPDVDYDPTLPKELQLPTLCGAGSPSAGQRVFKIGRTTGLTFGTVVGIDEDVPVRYSDKFCNFEGLIAIDSVAGSTFFAPGDSGAVIVGMDGIVLGLGFAFDSIGQTTFAAPIAPILEFFKCELLLPTN